MGAGNTGTARNDYGPLEDDSANRRTLGKQHLCPAASGIPD